MKPDSPFSAAEASRPERHARQARQARTRQLPPRKAWLLFLIVLLATTC